MAEDGGNGRDVVCVESVSGPEKKPKAQDREQWSVKHSEQGVVAGNTGEGA